MSLPEWPGPSPYLAVFVATVIEGEVVFVAATVLVQLGRLEPVGVFAAAALGGSVGDQLYFYALRGPPAPLARPLSDLVAPPRPHRRPRARRTPRP